MTPRDVIEVLQAQPFEPFEVELSAGERFRVRRPENLVVSLTKCYLFEYENDIAKPPQHISLKHIVRLIPLNGTPSPPARG